MNPSVKSFIITYNTIYYNPYIANIDAISGALFTLRIILIFQYGINISVWVNIVIKSSKAVFEPIKASILWYTRSITLYCMCMCRIHNYNIILLLLPGNLSFWVTIILYIKSSYNNISRLNVRHKPWMLIALEGIGPRSSNCS